MPQRNLSFRSKRYRLGLALALCCSMASQGCRSGVPEAATWEPKVSYSVPGQKVARHSASKASVGNAQRAEALDAADNFKSSAEDHRFAGEPSVTLSPQVGVSSADFVENDSGMVAAQVATASMLRPAEPFQLQEPEEVDTPQPAGKIPEEESGDDKDADNADSSDSEDKEEARGDRKDRKDDDSDAEDQESSVPPLYLEDVVASVRNTYPKIREAIARQAEASGQIVTAWGNFDTVLGGESLNQPLGFYENYRHQLGLKQPLWNGGYASAGYRLGDGHFEPWYLERETNEGGEFKIGVDLPVLQNRAIDKRRVAIRAAELRRGQTDPELFREILMAQGDAAFAYWTWVASGLNVEIQEALLKLANDRVEQLETEIEQGNIPVFRKLDNDRLIASREIKLIDAERKFGQSAVKLSMYLRDENGMPLLPPPDAVPESFPPVPNEAIDDVALVNAAIGARPETRILQFDAATLRVELAQANNQLLPELNVVVETSQDVGARASSKGDKQPAIVEAGFYGEVPLQRRAARGKIDSLSAKLRQVEAKLQFASDSIATEVQQILVAREAALRQIQQAEINLELARETLRLGTIGLDKGEFDLLLLNIYEQALADAEAAMLVARADFFIADALLRIATGTELDVSGGVQPEAPNEQLIPPAAVAP